MQTLDQKINDRISPEPMSGCWLWQGMVNDMGYAILVIGRRRFRVHRLMWEQQRGSIPDGLLVCHKCDVPCCVNPDHLFLGTQHDNIHDMIRKGRRVKANLLVTHCPKGHPYDETNTYQNGVHRRCRACGRAACLKWYYKKAAA